MIVVLQQIESAFNEYVETLSVRDKAVIESLMKAYYYLKSFRITKSVSDRNLTSELWWYGSLIDEMSIRTSFFKATSGLINLARAGVKNILGDDDRSVVVQIVDELVNGKFVYEQWLRD